MPSLFVKRWTWSDSPYINHFLQPDTDIPASQGVQGLNRYAYVNNNPLRYADPTGHNWEDCGGRSGYRCLIHMKHVARAKAKWVQESDPYDQDGDGIPDIPNPSIILYPLATAARYPCAEGNTYLECLYARQPLVIDGTLNIDLVEFKKMLMGLFYDLQNRDTTPSNPKEKWNLMWGKYKYDTPFWNGYGFYPGKGCISNKCYERQEINYVAQGMWAADSGQTLGEGFYTVYQWKHDVYNKMPSDGTFYWFRYGYYFYTSMDYHSREYKYNK